jgi:glycine oxidase
VPKSIVIAGAGAIGATAAYVLARAGHAVTVVDPAASGANASGVAAGMLAPAFEALFDAPMAGRFALLVAARDLWAPLADEIGLTIARDGAAALGAGAGATVAALRALGAAASLVSGPGDGAVAFTPEDWRLDPTEALAALRRAAERHGARFESGRVVEADPAATLVVATGAGQDLTAVVAELAMLTPIKGHILRAEGDFGAAPVLRTSGLYLCRTPRGAILGATMEPGVADSRVDPEVVRRLLGLATSAFGAWLGDQRWRAAVGVRAATPDGLPLVGRSRTPGVILAAGARRNGWLLAPMIAAVVLDAVEGRESPHASLFDPARFAVSPG